MTEILEWYNDSGNISYPLVENDSRTADTGFELDNDVLLDAQLLSYTEGVDDFYLKTLTLNAGGTTQTYLFDYAGIPFSIIITPSVATPHVVDYLVPTALGGIGSSLQLVFGEGVSRITNGGTPVTHTFENLRIEPARISVRTDTMVEAIGVNDPTDVWLMGDIELEAGFNMRINFDTGANRIRFTAARGSGKGVPCEKILPTDSDCDKVAYYLNGVPPDDYGNMKLQVGPGIVMTPIPEENKLRLESTVDPSRPGCKDKV